VLIEGVEQEEKVAVGQTVRFDVTRNRHIVQVKFGGYEGSEQQVVVWGSRTLTTKPCRSSSQEVARLVLRPPGNDWKSITVGCLLFPALILPVLALCASAFLYLKDASFANYVTDQWHWYGSPWSATAGECLHDDTETTVPTGPWSSFPALRPQPTTRCSGFTDLLTTRLT
jgi:hypothetical protein